MTPFDKDTSASSRIQVTIAAAETTGPSKANENVENDRRFFFVVGWWLARKVAGLENMGTS